MRSGGYLSADDQPGFTRVAIAPGGPMVDCMDESGLVDLVARVGVSPGAPPTVIANQNLHSLHFWYGDGEVREFFGEAEYVHADGMSVILLNRLFGDGSLSRRYRLAYLDFMDRIWSLADDQGWRVYLLGGSDARNERFREWLHGTFPGVELHCRDGFFDVAADSADVVADIGRIRPHLLLIGMGMPRQERWLQRHRYELSAGVVMTSGAYPDYMVGEIRVAPRWLGRLGLEWAYRLITSPRRTGWRYLVEPWVVVARMLSARRSALRTARADGGEQR